MNKLKKIILISTCLALTLGIFNLQAKADEEVVNAEVKNLNEQIQSKRERIKQIKKQQEAYSKIIQSKKNEQINLGNQINILDNRIAKAELDIEKTNIEIDELNLEKEKINLEIKDTTEKISKQKEKIAQTIKLLHIYSQKNLVEIFLLNASLTDFLNQVKYLEDINKSIKTDLNKVKQAKKELRRNKLALDKKQNTLEALQAKILENKKNLEREKGNKKYIISEVKNSENEFQKLMAEAKQEQENAASEISGLEKTVREKIAGLSGKKLEFNDKGLIWPVPKNTITALFHDPEYPYRHIFEHPAIDIRAGQGTPLKAAASGYVARAKNAGYGYSYIMIIHGNGLSTVYGHVSAMYVKEDEYVVQGQLIGKTGGMPGTLGAGRLTTGPHLHFEIRLNGVPVNPLEYLN